MALNHLNDPTEFKSTNYRWYVLAVLTAAHACHALDRAIIGLMLEPIGREFGLSDNQLGLIAGPAYAVAFACVAIPVGLAVDRFNRSRLLALAISVWSGFTMLCGAANSMAMLAFARAAVGGAEAAGGPAGLSLISDYFRPEERSTAIGIWYSSAGVGAVAAFLGGGYIAEHYGWRFAFLAAGVPGLLIALVILRTVGDPRSRKNLSAEKKQVTDESLLARFALIVRVPGVIPCAIGLVLMAMVLSGFSVWVVSFLIRKYELQIAEAGVIVGVGLGVLASVGALAAGIIVDRGRKGGIYHPQRPAVVAAIICMLSGAAGLGMVVTSSLAMTIAMLFAFGLVAAAYNGPANGLLLTIAPPHLRGLTISGLQFFTVLVGAGMGPLVVGSVSSLIGPANGIAVGLGVLCLCNVMAAISFVVAGRQASATGQIAAHPA